MEDSRARFRSLNCPLLKDYYPFGKKHKPCQLWRGGLAETVALMNSLIVAIAIALAVNGDNLFAMMIHGLAGFGLSLTLQFFILAYQNERMR